MFDDGRPDETPQHRTVVQLEQSVRYVCLSVGPDNNFELDLDQPRSRYFACWFNLMLSGLSSKIEVMGKGLRPQEETMLLNWSV